MSADPSSGPSSAELVAQLLERCTFPPSGTDVTCAVSGGADSTALLVLAVAAGCRVVAAHVDHGLRDESAAEAEVVRRTAARFGADFRSHRVDVGDGPNVEARARAARYGVLPLGVLTGHTADDQAETVLANLTRGSAATGLAAMRPGERRPLLGLRRADTVALCRALAIEIVHDPSNDDPRFLRNRIRHEVLPLLSSVSGRDVVPVLTRQADLLRDDDDLLDELALAIDPTDALALRSAPLPLARRAVRRWLADPYPPDLATVGRVLGVAAGAMLACEVGAGRRVERSRQRLRLVRSPVTTSGSPRQAGQSIG